MRALDEFLRTVRTKNEAELAKWLADEWREIEILAIGLMAGVIDGQQEGRPQHRYLDGDEEVRARAAMALLLRSGRPLTQEFLNQLAALFDPNDNTHPAIDRELFFKRRGAGQRHRIRDTAIAQYISDRCKEGDSLNAAQKKATEKFHLSLGTVEDIWGHEQGKGYCRRIDLF